LQGRGVGQVCLFVVDLWGEREKQRERESSFRVDRLLVWWSVWSVRRGQRVGKIVGVGYGAAVGVFGGEGASWDVPGTSVRLKRARRSAVLGTKRACVRLRKSFGFLAAALLTIAATGQLKRGRARVCERAQSRKAVREVFLACVPSGYRLWRMAVFDANRESQTGGGAGVQTGEAKPT